MGKKFLQQVSLTALILLGVQTKSLAVEMSTVTAYAPWGFLGDGSTTAGAVFTTSNPKVPKKSVTCKMN